MITPQSLDIHAPIQSADERILTPEALEFIETLHKQFDTRRHELLAERRLRQEAIDRGQMPDFLPETEHVRSGDWQVAPIPQDLQFRRTEITGPVDRKMIINALNSGASVFMADFEDANSPTWRNCLDGQANLYDAIRRQVDFSAGEKQYKLNEKTAVLKVRPRGWHLDEKHVTIEGQSISASLFDFGLYFFHNAQQLLDNGSGPYFYLPKLESHREARLWNDVFVTAQKALGIPVGTIKVTVLIETIMAAFEMEEIIYELRDHMAGLNAGRWDYIFSAIKKFRNYPDYVLPDRVQVTMKVPFMFSYTELLVKSCHKRGAHAIGGMAAFIPSRRDEEVNRQAFEKVKADKEFEASNGFDGTWVAHPDLVPVARKAFDEVIGERPHQKDRLREEVSVAAKDLLNFQIEGGHITEKGLRTNINVGILYIASWLEGTGAAALYNLMEDAATAEISRAQVWQWLHNEGITLSDGTAITPPLIERLIDEELASIRKMVGDQYPTATLEKATHLFRELVLSDDFEDFLTLLAYVHLA